MESDERGSVLGTHDHWKDAYQQELKNFLDHGDYGEIWFGKESITRVIKWIQSSKSIKKEDPVIEVGCGNGTLLLQLAKEGYTKLVGVDYVEEAIHLAKSISAKEKVDITYEVGDILTELGVEGKEYKSLCCQYKTVIDKGTYDAISLCPDKAKIKQVLYVKNISKLLLTGGLFIICSCNYTSEELKLQFQESSGFRFVNHIPFPTFQFGGQTGSSVSALVFEKN